LRCRRRHRRRRKSRKSRFGFALSRVGRPSFFYVNAPAKWGNPQTKKPMIKMIFWRGKEELFLCRTKSVEKGKKTTKKKKNNTIQQHNSSPKYYYMLLRSTK
jgi:hypothetical protein